MKKSELKKIIKESLKGLIKEQGPGPFQNIGCSQIDFTGQGWCSQLILGQAQGIGYNPLTSAVPFWHNWLAARANSYFNTGGGANCQSFWNNYNQLKQQLINGVNGQGVPWNPMQIRQKKAQMHWLICMTRQCQCT